MLNLPVEVYTMIVLLSKVIKVLFTIFDVNLGFSYQGHKDDAKYDEHKATLVWKPVDEKKRSRREESECAGLSLSFLFIV